MTPCTTPQILTRLIVRNEHHTPIQSALLDALFAVRRITWTPAKR